MTFYIAMQRYLSLVFGERIHANPTSSADLSPSLLSEVYTTVNNESF